MTCVFDIVVGRDLLAYARNHDLLLYHVQPASLELHGPIFRYQASHYIEQVKLIEIPSSSRIMVCLQTGKKVEYAWVELPSVKATAAYPLYAPLKVHCLVELETSEYINFIYIPFENRLAVFGDDEIFVTEAISKEASAKLALRQVSIPMQTEFGALVNYIPAGKDKTSNVCVSYESRFKAEKGTVHLGKALLMTRLDIQTHLPDLQWCEWDFKAMKLRVSWRFVSLRQDHVPHCMFSVADDKEADEYALLFCKSKLEVFNNTGSLFHLELDDSVHITSLAILPVDKMHASVVGVVHFLAACVYGEFRLGKVDLYDNKLSWISPMISLKVLDLYDEIHAWVEVMPAVQCLKLLSGGFQDTQKNPSPYLPTTHHFIPDGRLSLLCYHPLYGSQVVVQVDAETGSHSFPTHTFSSWNLHFTEARGLCNPALPFHRGVLAMAAPTVSVQQPSGDVFEKSFVASQVLLTDHGLQLQISSSTVLDLGYVLDSRVLPVQPIASSNAELGSQSNVAVMLTSRHHQISSMLSYNVVQATYSPMDKITGLKTDEYTVGAYNLGAGVTLQVTSRSLSAVAGNNSSNKLLWSTNIHALLAKYLSSQHASIVYELRRSNASIVTCSMVPNILYLSLGRHVVAVFLAVDQVGQSSSSGDMNQGGVLISCINRMDIWSIDKEVSHIHGAYSRTLSVFGVSVWDSGGEAEKALEVHYYKLPPKTTSAQVSMLTKHTTHIPVHLPKGFIKCFVVLAMGSSVGDNIFCAVIATSDNMLRVISFVFDTDKDEIACKYLEIFEVEGGVESLVELSHRSIPYIAVSSALGNFLLLLSVQDKARIRSHLVPLTRSLTNGKNSIVNFFPVPQLNQDLAEDFLQRVGYFFSEQDADGSSFGKLSHAHIDVSQLLAVTSIQQSFDNRQVRLRGNPVQALPVEGSILSHCYDAHHGCLFLLSQHLPTSSNGAAKARNRDQVLSIFSRTRASQRLEFRFSLPMETILKRFMSFDEETLMHYDEASKVVGIYQYPDSYHVQQVHGNGNGTQVFHLLFYDTWCPDEDCEEATTKRRNFDVDRVVMNTLYLVSFAYDFQCIDAMQGLTCLTFHTFDFFDPAMNYYYNRDHVVHAGDGVLDSQRISIETVTAFRTEDVSVHDESVPDNRYMCILTPDGRLRIFGWTVQIVKKDANRSDSGDAVDLQDIEVDLTAVGKYQQDYTTEMASTVLASCYVFSKDSEDLYFYFNAHEEKYAAASATTVHNRQQVCGELNYEIASGSGHKLLQMSIHDSMIAVTIPMYGVRLFQLNSVGLRERAQLQIQYIGEFKDPSSRMLFPTLVTRRNTEQHIQAEDADEAHSNHIMAVAKVLALDPGPMLSEKDDRVDAYRTISFSILKQGDVGEDDVSRPLEGESALPVFDFRQVRVQQSLSTMPGIFWSEQINSVVPRVCTEPYYQEDLEAWATELDAQRVVEQDLVLTNTMGDTLTHV